CRQRCGRRIEDSGASRGRNEVRALLELLDAGRRKFRLPHRLRALRCRPQGNRTGRRNVGGNRHSMTGAEDRSRGLLAVLALSVLVIDQATKYAVSHLTRPGSLREVIPGLLNLVHTSNPGVAFGFLADSEMPWRGPVLILFSLAVMSMIVW